MSDSIKEFYKGNSDGMVMVLGSAYYKGSVKLEISDVRTSNTATQGSSTEDKNCTTNVQFKIGSVHPVLPPRTLPSAHLLSQELHDTEVLNWNEREIRDEAWNVPTFYNIHKIPHSDLKPTNGSDLSNVGFDEALAQQIMSLEGKEGVHTIQGTVLGVTSEPLSQDYMSRKFHVPYFVALEQRKRKERESKEQAAQLGEGTSYTEAKTTDIHEQSGKEKEPHNGVRSQNWEKASDWDELQSGSATEVGSMITDFEKEEKQSEDGESHYSDETLVSQSPHNESKRTGFWESLKRSFR